jgi:hypothetical protein
MTRGCRSTWGGLEEYGQTRAAAATADKQTDDCSLQEAQLQNDQDRAEHQRPTYVTLLDISTLTSGGQNKRRAVTDEEVVKATSAAPGFFSQTLISECASRHFFICYASTEECATPRERSMPGLQDSSDVAAVSRAATHVNSAASTMSIHYFTPVASLALGIPLLTVKGTDFKPGQLL